jgi:phthiocerol/phenolphthiocerol synthesis type-I polyketide synthase E
MALAGGVSIRLPQVGGYLHEEGMILSPDGRCRAYDAAACGTVSGDGVGVVVLKRHSDAVADGDVIRGVIRGSAVNNDGGRKVGFTAPSVAGQARVIGEALAVAGVAADSIGYVEGHGTGTRLGDPLEVAALNEAYRGNGERRIALGSVKPNIGHLDTAAGVVGLIKVVLGLEHGEIPPSLHFERANPAIDFASGPFYVPQRVEAWPVRDGTRRGAVSSFGIGGTNAHVIVEAAAPRAGGSRSPAWQVLPVSGRSAAGLSVQCGRLAESLSDAELADAAYTLSVGRRALRHRRAVVARDVAAAAQALRIASGVEAEDREVAFLFPGQGAQRARMGAALYREGGVYREAVRDCAGHLSAALNRDVLGLLAAGEEAALNATSIGQAALFAVSYGLARQWEAWGVSGTVLLGHSLGEYVAGCLAGVFSLADAARLVAARGRLMEAARGGAMVAVALDEASALELCAAGVSLAAVNGPQQSVLSGDADAIASVEARLAASGQWCRRLGPAYGFHSHLLDGVVEEFAAIVRGLTAHAPQRRMVSSVTGDWLSAAEAQDPNYWSRQMRVPVRFWAGLRTAAAAGRLVFLEVGPGRTLSGLARATAVPAVASWPSGIDEEEGLALALGRVWEAGGAVDWAAVHGPGRRRVVLPGIAFERRRHWLEASGQSAPVPAATNDEPRLYAPVWRRWLGATPDLPGGPYLVVHGGGVGAAVAAALVAAGRTVVEVVAGGGYGRPGRLAFTVAAGSRADYGRVLAALREEDLEPHEIVHALSLDAEDGALLDLGFHAAHALVQALIGGGVTGGLTVVSRGAYAVTGSERLRPAAATLRGLVQVVPQEHPGLRCRSLDVAAGERDDAATLAAAIVSDLGLAFEHAVVARRGRQLWVPDHQELARPSSSGGLLRHGGVYLITGGLGAIGLTLAHHLATKYRARIALIARNAPRDANHDGVADRLRAIADAAGGLIVSAADVADEAAMQAVVATIEAEFGPLNGVVHAAGIVGVSASLATVTREAVDAVMRAKLSGTEVLDRLFARRPLDFICLMSSLSVELGGPGLGAYAAANCALDGFAGQRGATAWTAIDWDGWRFQPDGIGIDPEAGVALWEDLLGNSGERVVVALGDFAARRARWQRPRPAPSVQSVARRSRTEAAVARAWEAVLGRPGLGPDDDFFDLGGDSLRALQVLSRLRGELDGEVPMRLLFESPSVAGFAAAIDRLRANVGNTAKPAVQRMEIEF